MSVMVERQWKTGPDMGARELRDRLADVINDATVYGKITFVTMRGRKVAAIVPVVLAEEALDAQQPAESESHPETPPPTP